MASMYVVPMSLGPGGPFPSGYPVSYYGGYPVLEPAGYQSPPLDPGYYSSAFYQPTPMEALYHQPEPLYHQSEPLYHSQQPAPAPPLPLPLACLPPAPRGGYGSPPSGRGGVLVPATAPLTVLTSAGPPPVTSAGLLTVSASPSAALRTVPSVPSCLLTPPRTPEPTVWVRPRLGAAPVADPRTLAEVHSSGCVQQWTKGLRLEDGLVAVHVRHEGFTVEPAFPGPISRHLVTDPAGVMHVCVPIRQFNSQVDYGMYVVWVTVFAELFNRTGQHWALVPQPPSTPKPSHIWRCFSTSAKIRFRCDTCQNAWTSMHGQVAFQYFLHKGPGAGTVFFQLFGQKCRVCVRQRQRERARAAASGVSTAAATASGAASAPGAPAAMGAAAAAAAVPAAREQEPMAAPMTPPPEEKEEQGAAAAAPAPAQAAAAAPVAGPSGGPSAPLEDDGVPYSNPMWYPDEVRRVLLELYCQVTSKLYPHLPRPTPPPGHQRRFGRPQQAHDPALCQGCSAGTCRMLKRR